MSKDVIVYWGQIEPRSVSFNYYLNVKEPQPIIKELRHFKENVLPLIPSKDFSNPLKCPAVIDSLKNTFYIPAPYNVEIEYKDQRITTYNQGQEFYDSHITLDCEQAGFFQLYTGYLFFTEEEGLTIRQRGASLSNTDLANNTISFEGKFDISKWFRPVNGAYLFKNPCLVKVNKGDPLYYVDFITEKNIVFKKFYLNPDITQILDLCVRNKNITRNDHKPLKDYLNSLYYEFTQSKIKNRLLKLIKENLLD